MPDALRSALNLCRRVQNSLEHFHFNGLYVDCIADWSVLLVNRSIVTVITLQNSYKYKQIPYASLQILRPAILLFNGIRQSYPAVKKVPPL
jgi:hypothetical protein